MILVAHLDVERHASFYVNISKTPKINTSMYRLTYGTVYHAIHQEYGVYLSWRIPHDTPITICFGIIEELETSFQYCIRCEQLRIQSINQQALAYV